MCGRFSLRVEMEELLSYYGLLETDYPYVPRFNIAPGQYIPALIEASGGRKLGPLRWGLVPSWSKAGTDKEAETIGFMMINARAESLTAKPSFRKPFASKRCVIPADGFYEWRKADKQPFRITMKDGSLFSLAALYDTWISPAGEKLNTCTVITTQPNELMGRIHERMPAIIPRDRLDLWLDKRTTAADELFPLLAPFPSKAMTAYPVSPIVGSAKNDVPACIEPYEIPKKDGDSSVQLELF